MEFPANLRYSKTHEWVRVDGDEAVIGISDYAQSELGDVVYIELPEKGRFVQVGEVFGTVESVKTVSDTYAPVSGDVVDVNSELNAQSELVNNEPYGSGWMVRIRMAKPDDVNGLLDATAYEEHVKQEQH
jgi:glycine cleavage system H protein